MNELISSKNEFNTIWNIYLSSAKSWIGIFLGPNWNHACSLKHLSLHLSLVMRSCLISSELRNQRLSNLSCSQLNLLCSYIIFAFVLGVIMLLLVFICNSLTSSLVNIVHFSLLHIIVQSRDFKMHLQGKSFHIATMV